MENSLPLTVLSVDWDYFINATQHERYNLFPDGGNEDLAGEINDIIWVNRYARSSELGQIEADYEALDKLTQALQDWIAPGQTKVMVADSHKHIFGAIKELYKESRPISIINIDYHHDCYDYTETLNCGNWVNQLFNPETGLDINPLLYRYLWVKRPDSDEIPFEPVWMSSILIKDFLSCCWAKGVPQNPVKLLFICRSGVWSPPHLDKEFIKFSKFCISKADNPAIVEKGILKSRYSRRFQKQIQELKKTYQDMINK